MAVAGAAAQVEAEKKRLAGRKRRKTRRRTTKKTGTTTARKRTTRRRRRRTTPLYKMQQSVVRARRRKPTRKQKRTVPTGNYAGRKAVISVRRRYSLSNPTVMYKHMAAGAIGLAVGYGLAEVVDRAVATRAPKNANKALYGPQASAAIAKKADGTRMAVSGLGTAVLALGSYMAKKKSPVAAWSLGGAAAGFGVKFLDQLLFDVIAPAVWKVKSPTEDSYANRLFPDKQDAPAASALPPEGTVATFGTAGPQIPRYGLPGAVHAPQAQQQALYVQGHHHPFLGTPAATNNGAVAGAQGAVGGCGCGQNYGQAAGYDLAKTFPLCTAGCQGTCKCGAAVPGVTPPVTCSSCAIEIPKLVSPQLPTPGYHLVPTPQQMQVPVVANQGLHVPTSWPSDALPQGGAPANAVLARPGVGEPQVEAPQAAAPQAEAPQAEAPQTAQPAPINDMLAVAQRRRHARR